MCQTLPLCPSVLQRSHRYQAFPLTATPQPNQRTLGTPLEFASLRRISKTPLLTKTCCDRTTTQHSTSTHYCDNPRFVNIFHSLSTCTRTRSRGLRSHHSASFL